MATPLFKIHICPFPHTTIVASHLLMGQVIPMIPPQDDPMPMVPPLVELLVLLLSPHMFLLKGTILIIFSLVHN